MTRALVFTVDVPSSKGDGTTHLVERWEDGTVHCDCPAFRFRRDCRHARLAVRQTDAPWHQFADDWQEAAKRLRGDDLLVALERLAADAISRSAALRTHHARRAAWDAKTPQQQVAASVRTFGGI